MTISASEGEGIAEIQAALYRDRCLVNLRPRNR